jgi:hypothetical protein
MEGYRLFWWRGAGYNFGDEITPWLFEKMCGVKQTEPCDPKENNVLLAVGSIMRLSSHNTSVWGSGIRNIRQSDFSRAKRYHAVRGPFTRNQLLNLGFECPPVYGDPGLLLPKYHSPKITKKYRLGIIPHVTEYADLKRHFARFPDTKVISLQSNDIERVTDEICECEKTASTSLHGIITSVAYGIPTRWIRYSNKIFGDGIKFYDFFASLDKRIIDEFDHHEIKSKIQMYNPIQLSTYTTPDKIEKSTRLYPTDELNLGLLADSCPVKA